MIDKKKIVGIELKIAGTKLLKDTIKEVSNLDKVITKTQFQVDLTKFTKNQSNIANILYKETNNQLDAINKVIPTLNVASQKFSDIAEEYKKNNSMALQRQVDEIDKLAKTKYGTDLKYTEESKDLYEKYFAQQQERYKDNYKKLIKISEEKKQYLDTFNSRNTAIQTEVTKDAKVVKDDEKETKSAKLILELKHLSDLKKDANLSDIVAQKIFLKEEADLITDRNARMKALEESALEHNKRNFLGLNTIKQEESKANYEAIKQIRLKNIEDAKEEAIEVAKAYDQIAKGFEEGSEGETRILEEKKNKLYGINEQILKDESAVHNSKKAYNEALVKQNEATIAKLNEHYGKLKEGMSGIQDGLKSVLNEWISDIDERLKSVTEKYTEVVAKHKESQQKITDLNKEAESASGGRALVVQEQLARQMEANEELANQEVELKNKKEKLEEEKASKEKVLRKADLGQKLIEGIANTAFAVTKALGAGPLIGQILAGIAAATGAIQTAIIVRQIAKLEDGGLLNGKRHTQGGMRIEGTNIEVEGDEYVVNRISTSKNLGLIDYINQQRRELSPADLNTYFNRSGQSNTVQQHTMKQMYQDGGQLTNLEAIDALTAPANDAVLEAISRINFQPVVSVVDITNTQNSITQVKDIAGV